MILPEIKEAIEKTGVQFDFIGFDACLMATVETGLALSGSADYLIASEESEAATGWDYTGWLSSLGSNPGISTVELGKIIADDFVESASGYYGGTSSTLSVTDLKELADAVPAKLKSFGKSISELIDSGNSGSGSYSTVSKARSNAREFASSSRVDQVDIVDFAKKLGTTEGSELAEAVLGAIRYNKVTSDMSGSYGLSIYFPYSNTTYASLIEDIYESLGMCEEYTECVQKFADTEMSGQYVSGGGSAFNSYYGIYESGSYGSDYYGSSYSDDYSSLFGSDSSHGQGHGSYSDSFYGGYDYSNYGSSYSSSDVSSILESLMGGYFGGRTLSKSVNLDKTSEFIAENIFDQRQLEFKKNSDGVDVVMMEESQWEMVSQILLNMYLDDGEGLIDLGTDNVFEFDEDGSLICRSDGTWLSIDGNIIAYYYESSFESDGSYVIKGYTPVLYNGKCARMIIIFDDERPDGYIAGISFDYTDSEETNALAKTLEGLSFLEEGGEVSFLADYYDYGGNYTGTYVIGTWTVQSSPEIANLQLEGGEILAMYSFTDIYNQTYWTKAMEVE